MRKNIHVMLQMLTDDVLRDTLVVTISVDCPQAADTHKSYKTFTIIHP